MLALPSSSNPWSLHFKELMMETVSQGFKVADQRAGFLDL